LVDFEKKSWEIDVNSSTRSMHSTDLDMEEERRKWEEEAKAGIFRLIYSLSYFLFFC
jgi:hypothetical protein